MDIIIKEECRSDRLEMVENFLKYYHVNPISIHDHKGCLEISWHKKPDDFERKVSERIWKDLGECYVEHTYPTIITEMVKL